MFARETVIDENGETVHIVPQVDNADGDPMERDLLIEQFGAYQNGSPETRDPANAIIYNAGEAYAPEYARTAVYKI